MKTFKGSKLLFLKYLLPVGLCYSLLFILFYLIEDNEFVINYRFTSLFFLFLVIVLFLSLFYTISVKFTLYEKKIRIQYGLFFKTSKDFKISSIKNISYRKSLLDILFKRTLVQFEIQDASSNRLRDLNIYLKNKEIDLLKLLLIKKCHVSEKIFSSSVHGNDIVYNKNELFLKALSVVSKFMGLIFFVFLIFTFINSFRTIVPFKAYLLWLLGIIGLYFIAYLFVASYFLIKFYGYTIINNKDSIVFSYGLIDRRQYTIMKKDINAIIIKQRLIDRILGKGAIKLDCTGLKLISDEQIKSSYLLPYCDISFIDVLQEKLNINLIYEPINMYRPTRFTYTNFVMLYPFFKIILVYLFLLLIGINNFLIIYTSLSLIFIYFIFEGFDKLSNQQLFFNENVLIVETGQLVKYRYYIAMNSVQKVIKQQNLLKKIQKVSTITIDYHSNFYRKAKCINLDDEIYDKLSHLMITSRLKK